MAIGKQGAKDLIVTLKAGTAGKAELLAELLDALQVLGTKAQALKAQTDQAAGDFAASKAGQYKAVTDALPDVGDVP